MWGEEDELYGWGRHGRPGVIYLTGPFAPRPRPYPGPFTSPEEIRDLTIAVIALALIFSMPDIRSTLAAGLPAEVGAMFFLVSLAAVLLCFFTHEMGHKMMARRYGCWAEFRRSDIGLLVGLFLSVFGAYVAAPGAVWHRGYLTTGQTGRVSAAGPATNALTGFLFLPVGVFFSGVPVLGHLAVYVVIVSGILGVFNMLPFFIFDGRKVWAWSPAAYVGLLSALIALLALAEHSFHFLGIL